MANIKTLIKGDKEDGEGEIGVSHLPGSSLCDLDTACGRTAEMRCEWKEGKGKVTCRGCLDAARNILENLTDAEIKELRPKRRIRRAVAAPTTTEAVSIPCPICGGSGHIGDCEED